MKIKINKIVDNIWLEIKMYNLFINNNTIQKRKYPIYRHLTKTLFNQNKYYCDYIKPKFKMNQRTMEFLYFSQSMGVLIPKTVNDTILLCSYCEKFYFGNEHNTIHYKCYLKHRNIMGE